MVQKKESEGKKKKAKQAKYYIGLDIDDKSVKLAVLSEKDTKKTVIKFAIKEIPPSDNKIEATSSLIKQIISEEGIEPGNKVYTCVYGVGPTIRRISIPIMPDPDIVEAVKWEVKNLIPFPIEGAIIDYYKIGKVTEKTTEKYDILAAIVQNEMLTLLINTCEKAGLQLDGISALPFALWNLVKESIDFKENEVIAIIDVGAEAASLNLFKNNILQFTRDITVAGDSITKAMTGMLVADEWQLNLSYEQAEEIKIKYGIPDKEKNEKTEDGVPLIHILEMISPTLHRLQNEITRSFDYYKDQFREEKVDKIFLTGGSSKLKNLDIYLSEALGIKVETLDPLRNIEIDPSLKPKEQQLNEYLPRLSLAIGLALAQTEMINFLKVLKPTRSKGIGINVDGLLKKFALPTKALAIAGVLIIVAALGLYFGLDMRRDWYRTELKNRQSILSDIKALNERKGVLADIAKEETYIRSMLEQVTKTLPQGVLLTNLIYDNGKKQIWLSGTVSSPGLAGRLIKSLEDSSYFKDVNLLEVKKQASAGREDTIFRVTMYLE